jgi:protein-S-isoprenylcysteine O-methyltransferase Ste14
MTGKDPRLWPVVGTFLFFWLAPGTAAGLVPYLITGFQFEPPLFGAFGRAAGVALIGLGLAAIVACFSRFALEGRGTPAPIAPPKILVVSGLYRYVRNPMYVAVLTTIVGEALLLGSIALLEYAALAWLAFHAFVLAYEEPTLRRKFGASYESYCANVRRWWPRPTPW